MSRPSEHRYSDPLGIYNGGPPSPEPGRPDEDGHTGRETLMQTYSSGFDRNIHPDFLNHSNQDHVHLDSDTPPDYAPTNAYGPGAYHTPMPQTPELASPTEVLIDKTKALVISDEMATAPPTQQQQQQQQQPHYASGHGYPMHAHQRSQNHQHAIIQRESAQSRAYQRRQRLGQAQAERAQHDAALVEKMRRQEQEEKEERLRVREQVLWENEQIVEKTYEKFSESGGLEAVWGGMMAFEKQMNEFGKAQAPVKRTTRRGKKKVAAEKEEEVVVSAADVMAELFLMAEA